MAESQYAFERFVDREGFNRALGHFQAVSSLLDDFEDGYNLADILNALLAEKEIEQHQVHPILYALLVDKYEYANGTYNMESTLEDFSHAKEVCPSWNGVDVVIAYHHPELGITLINPKNPAHWDALQNIRKNELVTIYAGGFAEGVKDRVARKAIDTIIAYLSGRKTKPAAMLTEGDFGFIPYESETEEEGAATPAASRRPGRREPVRASATHPEREYEEEAAGAEEEEEEEAEASETAPEPTTGGNRRMTPMYSVPVTNELFHNGNVEAWKKIIQSYRTKYPDTEVLVFYEGERIHDINTLFKWGKVKHGSTILFALVGEEIKDVAKLQRYFKQGASPQFEAFLRVPMNTALKLF